MKHSLHFTLLFTLSFFLVSDLFGFAPPANDNCVDAIEITDLSSCNSIHVDGTDATNESNTTGCDPNANDVWYKFTATSKNIIVEGVEFSDYGGSQISMEFYADGCSATNSINGCSSWDCEGCRSVFSGFIVGNEYYLRVWFQIGTEAEFCLKETCDVSINNFTTSTCDNGDNTYDLTVDVSGTELPIGDSLMLFIGGAGTGDNGWKIVNSTSSFTYQKSGLIAHGAPVTLSIVPNSSDCYEHYHNYYTAPSPCVPPPSNDDCANAIELTDFSACTTIHVEGLGATPSNTTNGCNPGAAGVWYKFTATSTRMEIRGEEFTDYGNSVLEYEIYTDGCNGMTTLDNNCWTLGWWCEGCSNQLAGLTIGDEYYLRIWFLQGQEADICLQDVCDIAVTSHTIGTCDNGDNTYDFTADISATGLEVGDSLVLYINGANADNGLKITNNTATFTFTVSDLPSNGSTMNLEVFEWNGGCSVYFQEFYAAPNPCVSPPANDDCANAIELSDFSTCTILHVNSSGATSANNTISCNPAAADIWYKFTATSNRMRIGGVEFTDYNNSELYYEIYTDGCAGMNRVDDNCWGLGYWCEGCTNEINGLTIGDEYYLRIWFTQGQEADICIEDVCELSITNHSVGTCDNGDNTYDLIVDVSASGLEVGDSLILFVEYGGGYADQGFKITSSTESFSFIASGLPSTGGLKTFNISEWNGGCFQGFYDYYTAPSPCVSPPANDDCANAIELSDLSACTTMHVNGVGATADNIANSCNPGATDVWYKFTATSSRMQIQGLEFTNYNNSALEYEIYTDGCGGMNRLDNNCWNLGYWCEGCTYDINGLTVGDEYYLRIWFYQGQEADICLQSVCDIEVVSHNIGTCDNGDNTYDLTVDIAASGLEIGDSLVLSISGYGGADNGLKITNNTANFTFTVSNLPATGSDLNIFIEEYNGGCFKYYADYYTAPSPCVTAPINDNCADATTITDFENCTPIHVNTTGATLEPVSSNCGALSDVWYTFVAPTTSLTLSTLDINSYGTQFFNFDVYEDGCSATTPTVVDCYGTCHGCDVPIENLTVGETYNLRIWLGGGTEADFCLKERCDFEIINISTTACNPVNNNTYDLTVEFSLTKEMIGDELVINSGNIYSTQTITSIENSYTFQVQGLPATGGPVSFYLANNSQNCDEFFYEVFIAPDACVTGPSNDDCAGAINIPDLENCNTIHFDNYGATFDNVSFCQSGSVGTWYQFTASVPSIEVKAVDLVSYDSDYLVGVQAFEGTCGNLNLLDCNSICENNCSFILNNLVIGQVYYLYFHNNFLVEGDICVQAIDGNICNDAALTLDMDVDNQATYQTQQTITAEGMIPTADNTTYIAEQSITLMEGFHAQAGAEFHAYIEDCTPPSPLVETPSEERTTAKVAQTTPTPLVEDLAVAPNPFRYSTNLKYTIEIPTTVSLHIYSLSGQLVQELVTQETQSQGVYEYTFEPKEDAGNFYFAVMTTPEQVITKKMIFIR